MGAVDQPNPNALPENVYQGCITDFSLLTCDTDSNKRLKPLNQGWENFSYGGPHLKKCCSRGPHTIITKYKSLLFV